MSVAKQILLSIVVLVIAAGAWFAYDRNMLPFLPHKAATAAGPGGGGGFGGPGGFAGGFGGGGPGGARGAAAPIIAEAVTTDNASMVVNAIGTVAASQAITIYPQVTGIVADVDFSSGATVQANQVLYHLINSDEMVALQKAKITLDSAQTAFDRAQTLAKANAATTASLSDAQTTLSTAQVSYQTAQLALDKKTILAPFAGVTGLSDVAVGDLVTSAKSLTTLDDVTTVEVSFDVPERATGIVAVGQKVTATTEALPGRSFDGTISAVDTRVDPTARTLRVEATLPNEVNVLKPGMAVEISMEFPGEAHPVVPSLAVQYDRNGSYVWKVDPAANVVHRVSVDVVDRRSGAVLVVASLQEGDLVGTEGLQRLRENSKVGVQRDDTDTPEATPAPVASIEPPAVVTNPTGSATTAPAGTGGNRPQGAGGGNRGAGAGGAGGAGAGGGQAGAAAGGGARGGNGVAGRAGGAGQGGQGQGGAGQGAARPAGAPATAAPADAAAPVTGAAAGATQQNG